MHKESEVNEVLQFINDGGTIPQASDKFGIPYGTIVELVRKKKVSDPKREEDIRSMYRAGHKSQEICSTYHVSVKDMYDILKKSGDYKQKQVKKVDELDVITKIRNKIEWHRQQITKLEGAMEVLNEL